MNKYESFKQSSQSAAEETAGRLEFVAEGLIKRAMRGDSSHKHKWATGKEKWEALQREGARAAGGQSGKGRAARTPVERLTQRLRDFNTSLQTVVAMDEGDPVYLGLKMMLVDEYRDLRAMGALDEVTKSIAEIFLG